MGCGTKRPAMYQCVTHLVLLPINSGLKVATFLFMCTEDRGEPICGERKCAEIESRQPPGSCSLGSETSLILIMQSASSFFYYYNLCRKILPKPHHIDKITANILIISKYLVLHRYMQDIQIYFYTMEMGCTPHAISSALVIICLLLYIMAWVTCHFKKFMQLK